MSTPGNTIPEEHIVYQMLRQQMHRSRNLITISRQENAVRSSVLDRLERTLASLEESLVRSWHAYKQAKTFAQAFQTLDPQLTRITQERLLPTNTELLRNLGAMNSLLQNSIAKKRQHSSNAGAVEELSLVVCSFVL